MELKVWLNLVHKHVSLIHVHLVFVEVQGDICDRLSVGP
jgi:hypothetical protein